MVSIHQPLNLLQPKPFGYVLRSWILLIMVALAVETIRRQIQFTSRTITIPGYDDLPFPEPHVEEEDSYSRGNRVSISVDEFFHQSPPSVVIDQFFHFQKPDWERDADRFRVKPLWRCQKKENEEEKDSPGGKLVFLHLTRSAGSTLRPFFRAYSQYCHRGLALIGQCVDLEYESIKGIDVWRNNERSILAGKDCWLGYAADRMGKELVSSPFGWQGRLNTAFLKENDIDIMAGHLSLGSGKVWQSEKEARVLYVVFLREPIAKYVSQILLVERAGGMTIGEAAKLVNLTASRELSKHHHRDSMSAYLITPQQKQWADLENVEWTAERRVNLTLSNLFQGHILLGLVERMDESFEMLRYAIDRDDQVRDIFTFFGSQESSSKVYQMIGNSTQRTKRVVEYILADPSMAATLKEFLKYELEIYSYAEQLHMYQYQWMVKGV